MTISPTISIGDIVLVLGLCGTMAWNYFTVIRRQDRLAARHDLLSQRVNNLDTRVDDLRRGRGLILEHWPAPFRRLFGFDANGVHRAAD